MNFRHLARAGVALLLTSALYAAVTQPAAPLPVTRVTLNIRATRDLALEKLQSQVPGWNVRSGPSFGTGQLPLPPARTFNLSAQNTPLFELLEQLLAEKNQPATWRMGSGPTSPADASRLDTFQGIPFARGPFLVVAHHINREADYRRTDALLGNRDVRRLSLTVQLAFDPALRPVAVAQTSLPTLVLDDNGTLWPAATLPAQTTVPIPAPGMGKAVMFAARTSPPTAEILMNRPANASHTLALLEGELPAWIADGPDALDTFTMTHDSSLARTYEGIAATFLCGPVNWDGPPPPHPGSRMEATFRRPPTMPDDTWDSWKNRFIALRATITGDNNQPLAPTNIHETNESDRYTIAVTLAEDHPSKYTIDLPTKLRPIRIPYHFENLPIP